jgi:hypothetical protein
MKTRIAFSAAVGLALLAVFAFPGAALAGTVSWTGQGVSCDPDTHICTIITEICGTANGADCNDPYLLWVFTGGPRVTSASIAIAGCGTATGGCGGSADGGTMTQKGNGAFQYLSPYCPGLDAGTLTAIVTYTGTAGNPQLTISHGCKPSGSLNLWCSPGYWRNADDASWTLTGYLRTDLYSSTSCGSTVPLKCAPNCANPDPTLQNVLDAPQTYGAAAFNCIGQLLTNTLCGGGQLNPECPNENLTLCPDNCPYDAKGNRKPDAPPECQ